MAHIESLEDFDEYKEQKEFEENYNGTRRVVTIIIIIVVSIILGLITYAICSALIGKKAPPVNETFIGEQIDLQDENVQILYKYVTYGADGKRNLKFVKEPSVTINNFSDEEKLYYALQFAQVEDFEFTGEMTQDKYKIYVLPNTKLDLYMKLFFGPNVSYRPVEKMTYPFTFQINKMNVGTMTYSSTRNGYDTIFAAHQDNSEASGIDAVYGELASAIRRADGGIVLQEKVVYTDLKTDGTGYAMDVYKDSAKTQLLETITGITEANLTSPQITLSKYPQTTIVEYSFSLNGTTVSFESSRIIQ